MLRAGFVLAVTVCMALPAPAQDETPTPEKPDPLHFHLDLALAQGVAAEKGKPVAVFFTASWCGWCRKMAAETLTDPAVVDAGRAYEWVRIDTDHNPAVARQFDVTGIPVTVLTDARGKVIDKRTGYMPPANMAAFLKRGGAMAGTAGAESDVRNVIERVQAKLALATTSAELKAALEPAVTMLAHPERRDRPALLKAIASLDGKARGGLLAWMEDDALRSRAAAATALAAAAPGGGDLVFDPFATAKVRAEQVQAWRLWLEDHPPTERPQPAADE